MQHAFLLSVPAINLFLYFIQNYILLLLTVLSYEQKTLQRMPISE